MKMPCQNIIYCVISICLVNANSVFSLDISEPVQRFQRAILSNNPIEELNNIMTRDLSQANVQSYVKSLIPESIESLQRSTANEDLLEGLVRTYVADQRITEAASNSDVQSILDVLNYEIGGTVLIIANSSIVVDVDVIEQLLLNHTSNYIKELYPDNFIMQIVANSFAQQQVKLLSKDLRSILTNKTIPVELVNEIISLISNSKREKRDLVEDFILAILRPQIAALLTPIQTEFNTVVESILTQILSLYSPTEQSNPVIGVIANFINVVVIRGAEQIVVFQTYVNSILDNLITGTSVTTARKRRDVDLEFENIYNLENVASEISHRRVTRDISDIFLLITGNINALVKNIFIAILSSQYATIGNIVTIPLRVIVNTLIDSILPCSPCSSIV